MPSFHGKIAWKRKRKREKKNYRSAPFQPDGKQKIPEKLKKLINTVMASFQTKRGWKRPRKRENKNYRSVLFLHDM